MLEHDSYFNHLAQRLHTIFALFLLLLHFQILLLTYGNALEIRKNSLHLSTI